jgi:hypothetical protein
MIPFSKDEKVLNQRKKMTHNPKKKNNSRNWKSKVEEKETKLRSSIIQGRKRSKTKGRRIRICII